MEEKPDSTVRYASMLKELIDKGYPEERAIKALTCSGYRGVDSAVEWLVNHTHDRRSKENDPNDFVLYLCPTGELLSEIVKYYEASFEECGWSSIHNFMPHITLTSFFRVPSHCVPQLIQVVNDTISKNKDFSTLLDNIPLELYASQNYMGLYISKSTVPLISSFLKDLKSNMDLCSDLKGHTLKDTERKFHLSLAYHFASENYRKLYSLVSTHIKPNSQCKWELQLFSRDSHFGDCEVYKVMHSYAPRRSLELRLVVDDYIFIKENAEPHSVKSEFVQGTSCLTGVSGLINTNLIKRSSVTNTWTAYLESNQTGSFQSSDANLSQVISAPDKLNAKNIYLMRHGERIDFTFTKNWIRCSFDKKELGENDVSNNNSIPLKAGVVDNVSKKKRSDSKRDKRKKSPYKSGVKLTVAKVPQARLKSKHSDHASCLKKPDIGSIEQYSAQNIACNNTEHGPTVKKKCIPKKHKKGNELKKQTNTTSYFKTRMKRKPMVGSEIEAILSQPDSQNDGLVSCKQMSKDSTSDNVASSSTTLSPTIDKNHVSETLPPKEIKPSSLKFGFLGLGQMGSSIVKNLLNSGHTVYIWNRTLEKCVELHEYEGAEILMSPCEVVSASDITFCCVSDGDAAREVVFGNGGVLFGMNSNKGYVEMSGTDAVTSNDIAEAIFSLGGRYLEVRLQGSYKDAVDGTLIVVAAGDRLLYEECSTCFYACGKHSFFLGEKIGNASNMNLVLRLMSGVTVAAAAEGMALADRCGIDQIELIEVLKLSPLNCSLLVDKCLAANEKNFTPDLTLKYLQKDVNMAIDLSDSLEQELPVTASANEMFKYTKKCGYKKFDVATVFRCAKH